MSTEATRFLRFCLVGVSNTLLALVAFALLGAAGVPASAASALAFGAGALNGYLLNRSWTFRGAHRGRGTILRYVAVQALGAGFSAVAVGLASSDLSLPKLFAEAVVLPFATVLTYSLSRTVVFRASKVA
jgi:putative flippase GtrA